jgi:hypothetical protein
MSIIQSIMGHITEIPVEKAEQEYKSILIKGESVVKAFGLLRDQVVMTNYRMITLNKQGISGKKHEMTSIPYKSIKRFSKESAGLFDLDAELRIWLHGDVEPMRWEFARGVDINQVYAILSQHVLLACP